MCTIDLRTLSVAQTTRRRMVGRLMSRELEWIWKDAGLA
jgi:hypothetical protein